MNTTPMTEQDLADYYQLSVSTIRAWRMKGLGPPHIVIGPSTIRYRMEDVKEYESGCLAGGYVAPNVRRVMQRTVTFLDLIAHWQIAPVTKDHVAKLAAELRTMSNHHKNVVDIIHAPSDNSV